MRVAPDDEVYRVNTVWLGPRGLTFPWTARYLAYAVWLVAFGLILLFEAVTPIDVGLPPVWEISIATLFTYAVMGLVDHDRPVASVWQTFVAEISAPRAHSSRTMVTSARKVRISHPHADRPAPRPARPARPGGGRRNRSAGKVD
jgi:hypothetical protein